MMGEYASYIFLDIDGVIATPESVKNGLWTFTDSKQDLLGTILDKTNAKIVISSSWRTSQLATTISLLHEEGFRFCDKIVGITIRGSSFIKSGMSLRIPRGVEINHWIQNNIHSNNGHDFNRKKIKIDYNYVILDDDSDMLYEHRNHFVKCNTRIGLTTELATDAINILNDRGGE